METSIFPQGISQAFDQWMCLRECTVDIREGDVTPYARASQVGEEARVGGGGGGEVEKVASMVKLENQSRNLRVNFITSLFHYSFLLRSSQG